MTKNKENITKFICISNYGFTVIEILVSIMILSVVMAAIFSFLWGASNYWKFGRDAADVTENARLGLNRMTRELKQSSLITDAGSSTRVSFWVDLGASSGIETVTYGFTQGTGGNPGYVWRTIGAGSQIRLVENVTNVEFAFFGNDYHCDTNPVDGVVTYNPELLLCSADPASKIARVDVKLTMGTGAGSTQIFVGQAWLRNRSQ